MTESVALAAVKQDGFAIQYVPESFRTEDVVTAAVKQDSDALRYIIYRTMFDLIANKLGIETE
jgi:hypothetical protein